MKGRGKVSVGQLPESSTVAFR